MRDLRFFMYGVLIVGVLLGVMVGVAFTSVSYRLYLEDAALKANHAHHDPQTGKLVWDRCKELKP